jgi:hypothetical protein
MRKEGFLKPSDCYKPNMKREWDNTWVLNYPTEA